MRKYILMTGVAAATLVIAPAYAQDPEPTPNGDSSLEIDLRYANEVDARMKTDVEYNKDVALRGTVDLDGQIDVDSSAVAVIDNKQILFGNRVVFREETSTDGQSGNVDPDEFGEADDIPPGEGDPADEGDTTIDIGFFAPIINTVEDFSVTGGTGNIGVNIAAGYTNIQENVAAVASSNFDGSEDDFDSAGWAEASLTSLQAAAHNFYGPDEVQSDPSGEDEAGNDYRDRNTVGVATISGTGNIGVNAAAGAFNLQKNALAVAVATDSALAEASAAVIQTADFNDTVAMDSQNVVEGAAIGNGTSGNLGVNLAAGVGNIQMNSLTIASSLEGGEAPPGGGGGGGGE